MIRNIWAVGRNYLEHALEMKESVSAEPIFFLKAGSCIVEPGTKIRLPKFSKNVQYEVEIALQFNDDLQIDRAGLAIDLTARDIQSACKAKGNPWTLAKSFPQACPLSRFFQIKKLSDLDNLNFQLAVNGEIRQTGNTRLMLSPFSYLCEFVCRHFPVCPGDILLTGTPKGVSTAKSGDIVVCEIPGIIKDSWQIA